MNANYRYYCFRLKEKMNKRDLMMCFTSEMEKYGDQYYNYGDYAKAIACYSRLFHSAKYVEHNDSDLKMYCMMSHRTKRSICYEKEGKYSKYLSDLNWIIVHCRKERGSNIIWNPELITNFRDALFRRADLYMRLGNTARSLADYARLSNATIFPKDIIKPIKNVISENMQKLCFMRHPSANLVHNVKNNKEKLKLTLNTNGWKKLRPKQGFRTLPFKHGHQMIEYNGKIYCFAGSNVMYGMSKTASKMKIK
eukprot:281579_1